MTQTSHVILIGTENGGLTEVIVFGHDGAAEAIASLEEAQNTFERERTKYLAIHQSECDFPLGDLKEHVDRHTKIDSDGGMVYINNLDRGFYIKLEPHVDVESAS